MAQNESGELDLRPGRPAIVTTARPAAPRFKSFHRYVHLPDGRGTLEVKDAERSVDGVSVMLRPSSIPIGGATQAAWGKTAAEAARAMAKQFTELARVLGEFADEDERNDARLSG